MLHSVRDCAHGFLLLVISAGLLTGCADFQNSMNRIGNSIAGIELPKVQDKAATSPAEDATDKMQAQESQNGKKQKKNALKCPETNIIEELGEVHEFTDMNPPKDVKRIGTARLTSLQYECRMTDQGKGQVDLFMTFESSAGPAAKTEKGQRRELTYPYFVATTNKAGEIQSKDVFALNITPSPNTGVIIARENIRQIIPVETPQDLGRYNIAIGFQMRDDQLDYNRRKMEDKVKNKPASLTSDKRERGVEDAHKQIRNLRE